MEIYLMRHAQAVSPSHWRGSDESRPLSDIGLAEIHLVLPKIEASGMNVQTLLVSPYLRTQETARIMHSVFPEAKVLIENRIASGARPDIFKNLLLASTEKLPFLIIGHNPDISIFASRCTGIPHLMDDQSLSPGEILALETGPLEESWMKGRVLWRKTLADWKKQP